MNLGLIAGVVFLVHAGALALREMVLDPKNRFWPDAPGWVRAVMFAHLFPLLCGGYLLIWRPDVAPMPILVVVSVSEMFVGLAMAANILRQRLPADVWSRIKRLQHLAVCKDGWFKARVSAGRAAIAPQASPQAAAAVLDAAKRDPSIAFLAGPGETLEAVQRSARV